MSETALKAVSLFGREKAYHEVAKRALPVLVRQALASQTIEYGVLAKEIGVSNARNLNYPLGSVGRTMVELSERWSESIPPIQALVINKADGLPGAGVGPFAPSASRFATATQAERRLIVNGMLVEVFTYSNWGRVLTELGIGAWNGPHLPQPEEMRALAVGGEGEEHRALKELVAETPSLVGASRGMRIHVEAPLMSGDLVDVLFSSASRQIAVEVKPERAPTHDILRGIFQCEKYQAVLEAQAVVEGQRRDVEVVLVLGGALPYSLAPVVNALGCRVIDRVTQV